MKAGYAALFTVVVAYTAYQGTSPSKPASSRQESRSSSDTLEHFPTIAGGVCKLNLGSLDIKALNESLARLSQPAVLDFYQSAYRDCRIVNSSTFPSARAPGVEVIAKVAAVDL